MRSKVKHIISHKKIPLLRSVVSWKDVEILEAGEKLVSLNGLHPDRISIEPQYFLQGIKDSMNECFVRETVAMMLYEASKLLPDGYKFIVWDSWRPIETQRAIFNRYKEKIWNQNPALSEEEVITSAQKYVSLPVLDEESPPPHSTGGAVDLSIIDQSDNYLDMGTYYDDFSKRAGTRYFEEKIEKGQNLSRKESVMLANRRLLFHTLTEVGFTNYPEEWWHYDYGNQFWAKIKGKSAVYGKMKIMAQPII